MVLLILFILAVYEIISALITAFNIYQKVEREMSSFWLVPIKSFVLWDIILQKLFSAKRFLLNFGGGGGQDPVVQGSIQIKL